MGCKLWYLEDFHADESVRDWLQEEGRGWLKSPYAKRLRNNLLADMQLTKPERCAAWEFTTKKALRHCVDAEKEHYPNDFAEYEFLEVERFRMIYGTREPGPNQIFPMKKKFEKLFADAKKERETTNMTGVKPATAKVEALMLMSGDNLDHDDDSASWSDFMERYVLWPGPGRNQREGTRREDLVNLDIVDRDLRRVALGFMPAASGLPDFRHFLEDRMRTRRERLRLDEPGVQQSTRQITLPQVSPAAIHFGFVSSGGP